MAWAIRWKTAEIIEIHTEFGRQCGHIGQRRCAFDRHRANLKSEPPKRVVVAFTPMRHGPFAGLVQG